MPWGIFLIINLSAATIREYFNKQIADRIDPFTGYLHLLGFTSFWMAIFNFIVFRKLLVFDVTVALSGVFFITGFIGYLSAVKYSLSQSILFQSYSILVTVMLTAIFLGEGRYLDVTTITGQKIVGGGVLAFMALWFLLRTDKKSEERLEKKWLIFILITIFSIGVGAFSSLFFIRKYSPVTVIYNQTLSFTLLIIVNLLMRKRIFLPKKLTKLTFTGSIFSSIAVLSFFEALKSVPAAKFLPLQQVSLVILTMITSIIFFNEKKFFTGKRLLGMGLGLIGIVLLVTG